MNGFCNPVGFRYFNCPMYYCPVINTGIGIQVWCGDILYDHTTPAWVECIKDLSLGPYLINVLAEFTRKGYLVVLHSLSFITDFNRSSGVNSMVGLDIISAIDSFKDLADFLFTLGILFGWLSGSIQSGKSTSSFGCIYSYLCPCASERLISSVCGDL